MNYLDIALPGSDDRIHTLRDFLGQKVVLYFYPKDNTSGCTVEAREFTGLKQEFADKGYMIIGVSKDSVASHKNFIKKQELDLLLLSDLNEEMVKAFSVLKEKSMYGRKYMGIERSTFLLDEAGNITKEYRGVSPTSHAKIVLEEI